MIYDIMIITLRVILTKTSYCLFVKRRAPQKYLPNSNDHIIKYALADYDFIGPIKHLYLQNMFSLLQGG